MEKIFKNVIFVFISFVVISCYTGRISNLDRKPNEAILIAKLNIKDEGKSITKSSFIIFDDYLLSVKPDDSCFIYFKLPLGKHYVSKVSHSNSSQKIRENIIWFEAKESKIYYIGDIYLNMDIDYNYSAGMSGIAQIAGNAVYEYRHVDNPDIYVEDNYELSTAYFTQIFPTNESVYKSLAEFDTLCIIKNFDSLKRDEEYLKLDPNRKSNMRRKMIK